MTETICRIDEVEPEKRVKHTTVEILQRRYLLLLQEQRILELQGWFDVSIYGLQLENNKS